MIKNALRQSCVHSALEASPSYAQSQLASRVDTESCRGPFGRCLLVATVNSGKWGDRNVGRQENGVSTVAPQTSSILIPGMVAEHRRSHKPTWGTQGGSFHGDPSVVRSKVVCRESATLLACVV